MTDLTKLHRELFVLAGIFMTALWPASWMLLGVDLGWATLPVLLWEIALFGYVLTAMRVVNSKIKTLKAGQLLSKEQVAAEAYQIIGYLADRCDLSDHQSVTDALDYFGDISNGESGKRFEGDILPFTVDPAGDSE